MKNQCCKIIFSFLQKYVSKLTYLFTHFKRIRIMDATMFQVPDTLEHVYPGSGGCAQTAGIKIQLEYDLHSGQFLNFQVENNDGTMEQNV